MANILFRRHVYKFTRFIKNEGRVYLGKSFFLSLYILSVNKHRVPSVRETSLKQTNDPKLRLSLILSRTLEVLLFLKTPTV